tara:strand:+ start:279 stop:479 length:201 start_codon:yes stop_codon:yes gene_type:complete
MIKCKKCNNKADMEISSCKKDTYEKQQVVGNFCEPCFMSDNTIPFPNFVKYFDDSNTYDGNMFDWR